jgi:hypothetical protein
MNWTCKTWTGLVKHGLVKHGLVKHGLDFRGNLLSTICFSICMYTPTSFPGLQCEDEARHEEALVWAGHVSTQKMAVFDSYSSRSGEIFLMKYTSLRNK